MCRLFGAVGCEDPKKLETALLDFGRLAETGNIPKGLGLAPGHKDGYGLAAYDGEDKIELHKAPVSASPNSEYVRTAREFAEKRFPLILGHLRKAYVGGNTMENTQPYVFGRYAFCHNGTVRNAETELPLEPVFEAERKGTSDSEIVFLYLVQTIQKSGDFAAGFAEGISKIRGLDYTAANILMSDGRTLLAAREANDRNVSPAAGNICEYYYTLFAGKDASGAARFISSEKLAIEGIAWEEIPNHTILAVTVADGKSGGIDGFAGAR